MQLNVSNGGVDAIATAISTLSMVEALNGSETNNIDSIISKLRDTLNVLTKDENATKKALTEVVNALNKQ
ncbi:hypothetical protein D7Z54_33180 [Salibacterium salarium]|uniref:Uncharacterized protein n=2 Tax=Salibacterium salarium TaxID=284579 RepID=A0A3R9P309_9BACI|nr:hypothetical protein D7Z54_33180 [Salibacterium salarium]